MPGNVQRRWDPVDRYDDILFRDSLALQAGELNDIQDMLRHRTKSVSDAIFKDGDLVDGAACVVDLTYVGNPNEALANLADGKVYIQGQVRDVASSSKVILDNTVVEIGIKLVNATVDEFGDPDLRDQATGSVNFGEPGAHRNQWTVSWALSTEDLTGSEFFSCPYSN